MNGPCSDCGIASEYVDGAGSCASVTLATIKTIPPAIREKRMETLRSGHWKVQVVWKTG